MLEEASCLSSTRCLTPDRAEQYTRSGHGGGETFYQILQQQATAHPDREALVDHRQRVTYGELCAGRAHGGRAPAPWYQPGDVVTIQLPSGLSSPTSSRCERIGAVANQIGPDFRSREAEYILRFSESRAFVCPVTFRVCLYPDDPGACPHLPDLHTVCVLGSSGPPDTVSLDEMISGQHTLPPLVPQPLGANEVMRMAFTSGTTGNPKGVTHSCNTTLPACRILNDAMEVGEHEVFLVYLPLGLNWGYLTLLQALMVGARAVFLIASAPAPPSSSLSGSASRSSLALPPRLSPCSMILNSGALI